MHGLRGRPAEESRKGHDSNTREFRAINQSQRAAMVTRQLSYGQNGANDRLLDRSQPKLRFDLAAVIALARPRSANSGQIASRPDFPEAVTETGQQVVRGAQYSVLKGARSITSRQAAQTSTAPTERRL